MGGNFAAKATTLFRPQTQVMQKFNGNVANVNKVSGGQQLTQKFPHSGNSGAGNSPGILDKNHNNGSHNTDSKSSHNNWWCSGGSKFCGLVPRKILAAITAATRILAATPTIGSNCWYYPNYGCNYGYYDTCSYGPQYPARRCARLRSRTAAVVCRRWHRRRSS